MSVQRADELSYRSVEALRGVLHYYVSLDTTSKDSNLRGSESLAAAKQMEGGAGGKEAGSPPSSPRPAGGGRG